MSVIYDQAKPEVHQLANEVLSEHHSSDLRLPNGSYVKLCILMARQEDKDDPEAAVKLNGYPCAAVVSIIPYKQRVDKRADAEIIIDELIWDSLTEPQQRALLDHEITHLQFKVDKNGLLETDDQGRPKLKMRLHDWQLGGFRSIAKRYGADALEVLEARKFEDNFGDVALNEEKQFA